MALGLGCTVAELEERLTSRELTEWLAYWQMEPWGQWRDNWHHAMTQAMLFNIHRGRKAARGPADFFYKPPGQQQAERHAHFWANLDAHAQKKGNP